VLLVDADLNRPNVAGILELDESAGLQGILAGTASFADVVQPVGSNGLHVITAGRINAGGTRGGDTSGRVTTSAVGHPVLASAAMSRFLAAARERYDVVVIDSPPITVSSDSLALAAQVDGIVVVVDARRTRQRMLTASLSRFTVAGGSVVGIVLNRTSPPLQLPHFGADTGLKKLAGV
jgi:Mrp family chromosome partitioning ATPase